MTTFLLYDDALRSHELRHEIGEPIGDPIAFIEHEGRRIVVGGMLEQPIFEKRTDVVDDFWLDSDLGRDDLVKDKSFPEHLIGPEIVARALEKLGVSEVTVPPTLQVAVADHLRSRNVGLSVDLDSWADRRRRKTPRELEGLERAQRAVETAMLTAAHMLREAERGRDGRLHFDGDILTAEWIREAMTAELLSQGAESEEILVQSGDACLSGHELGSGPILVDQSCIIDCFPRDRQTGVYTDMTRTFVPGRASEELVRLHADCRAALEIAWDCLRPGRDDAYQKVCEFFHSKGYPTRAHHEGEGPLREGFLHALGHGVGLEVHEKPWMGGRADAFVEGDVVAVEPGLYFAGIGGVRLEDTVLVGADGVEHLTDPLPYDLEP
jgi:Xaa-Pro aminopeptidase